MLYFSFQKLVLKPLLVGVLFTLLHGTLETDTNKKVNKHTTAHNNGNQWTILVGQPQKSQEGMAAEIDLVRLAKGSIDIISLLQTI
jgi:hypothetical protein